jgi:hypothetical protein
MSPTSQPAYTLSMIEEMQRVADRSQFEQELRNRDPNRLEELKNSLSRTNFEVSNWLPKRTFVTDHAGADWEDHTTPPPGALNKPGAWKCTRQHVAGRVWNSSERKSCHECGGRKPKEDKLVVETWDLNFGDKHAGHRTQQLPNNTLIPGFVINAGIKNEKTLGKHRNGQYGRF